MDQWFQYETGPRFADTDAYGMVHHSAYYQWLEETRFAFARDRLGLTLDQLNSHGVQVVVLQSACRHRVPVRYGDRLRIELRMTFYKAAKFAFDYRIRNVDTGQVHAEASTSHAYIRPDGRLLLAHPEWIAEGVREAVRRYADEISLVS